ncbi:MAG: penicillin-binding transpeptidase domain-containing protein, partial [Bacillota bacterium]|nr:penicillin-binding transpeptidase domain-containing protein [Bacillota bacterium]
MRRYLDQFFELCKNRIFVMLCGIIVLFAIIVLRLFSLQIIHGSEYEESITASVSKELPVPAPRGNIYDRFGRPLAINSAAYCVQVDGSVTLEFSDEERQELAASLTTALWAQGETQTDSLPITRRAPYRFTFEGSDEEKEKQEIRWKTSIGLEKKQRDLTAEECLQWLGEIYPVPEGFTTEQARTYFSLCLSDDRNLMALTLAMKLTEYGEEITDTLPMDTEAPYSFQFNGNKNREKSWKESMGMKGEQLYYNSVKTLDYLRDYFGLPEGLPNDLVRSTLGIRYSMYLQRYQQYQTVNVATDVSDKTLAFVEENQDTFPCVIIDTVSLREYPQGKYFSHIIGYIRQMTENDYALYQDDVDAEGNPIYSQTDIVGQDGMEKLYERELNGTDGKVQIEVDNQGRRMSIIDSTEPIPGKDLFLTLDSELQKVAYDTLESELRKAVLNKLTTTGKNSVSTMELFQSMISINHISAQKMLSAEEGTVQHAVYLRLKQMLPDFDTEQEDAAEVAKDFLLDALERGNVSTRELTLMMIEQEHLPVTEEEKNAIESGRLSPLNLIIRKLSNGEMSPADTGLDPCTGSVFVTRVGTGEVLASVTYPSYDNNELVNSFNNSYYNDLLQDGNTPLVNRPLKQKKASGSTFKMITALAGLESGTITPETMITDKGVFKDTGVPYARCWIYSNTGGTHKSLNVSQALEVSCNYFFYELAYRMGNATTGT